MFHDNVKETTTKNISFCLTGYISFELNMYYLKQEEVVKKHGGQTIQIQPTTILFE